MLVNKRLYSFSYYLLISFCQGFIGHSATRLHLIIYIISMPPRFFTTPFHSTLQGTFMAAK